MSTPDKTGETEGSEKTLDADAYSAWSKEYDNSFTGGQWAGGYWGVEQEFQVLLKKLYDSYKMSSEAFTEFDDSIKASIESDVAMKADSKRMRVELPEELDIEVKRFKRRRWVSCAVGVTLILGLSVLNYLYGADINHEVFYWTMTAIAVLIMVAGTVVPHYIWKHHASKYFVMGLSDEDLVSEDDRKKVTDKVLDKNKESISRALKASSDAESEFNALMEAGQHRLFTFKDPQAALNSLSMKADLESRWEKARDENTESGFSVKASTLPGVPEKELSQVFYTVDSPVYHKRVTELKEFCSQMKSVQMKSVQIKSVQNSPR